MLFLFLPLFLSCSHESTCTETSPEASTMEVSLTSRLTKTIYSPPHLQVCYRFSSEGVQKVSMIPYQLANHNRVRAWDRWLLVGAVPNMHSLTHTYCTSWTWDQAGTTRAQHNYRCQPIFRRSSEYVCMLFYSTVTEDSGTAEAH